MNTQWLVTTEAVLSVFTVIAVGAALRKSNIITAEADSSLLRLVVNLLIPCLVFDKVVQSTAFDDATNIIMPPIVGFSTVAIGIMIAAAFARLGPKWTGLQSPRSIGTFAACVGIYNYGFIPIPLVERLWPGDDRTLSVLFMHNPGVELAIWTLGVLFISGKIGRMWWRQVINAPSVTIVLALSLNLLGWGEMIPGALISAIHWLGAAAIPMSMILIGATIAESMQSNQASAWTLRANQCSIAGCLVRAGLLPGLFIILAWLLPCSIELKRIIVIQAAMPAAVFPIVMSRHYNGDPQTALRVILSSSLLSIVTIPVWIVLGLRVIGG